MARTYMTRYAWVEEDGSLHFDIPAMLRELGVADTPTNRNECTRIAQEFLTRALPHARQEVVEDK
jgi:hypothetical protein